MTDNDTKICGADTTGPDPCQNPAGDNGWCWIPSHNPDSDEENPQGRETTLDQELVESITSSIAEGKSVTSAVRMAGIPKSTYYNWLDRGEGEEDTIYAELLDRHVRARGLGEDYIFSTVWEIAEEEGDLATLMSILKQRYPETWGDVDRGEQAGTAQVNIHTEAPSNIDELVDAVKHR